MAVQQITELATTHMTLGAHNKFNIDVNNAIIQATAAALRVENYATLYAQKIEEESRIVNRQTAMASTVDVSAADRQRDSAVGVIMNLTNAHTTSIIAEKADAAKKLRQLLAPYKGIGNHAYQKETAEINGMVAVLTTGDGATYAATLGMDDEVDALMQANAAFEEAYARNQEEAATLAALQSVDTKELRAQVDALYQQIVLTVNAVAVLQPTDEVTAFIQKVNGIIYKAEQEMGTSTASKPLPDSPGTGEGGGTDTPTDPDAGSGGDDGEGGRPRYPPRPGPRTQKKGASIRDGGTLFHSSRSGKAQRMPSSSAAGGSRMRRPKTGLRTSGIRPNCKPRPRVCTAGSSSYVRPTAVSAARSSGSGPPSAQRHSRGRCSSPSSGFPRSGRR